ncbi:SCO0607 family lipoprotein [Streptomyces sp. NPDC096176]|uniref:SCO0607 family lipoprotein n=1 Tax=Streptomyces sp. NPDC096176 TaxID=3366079 RepID=UPI0037F6432F
MSHRISRPATAFRPGRLRVVAAAALAGSAAVVALTGCASFEYKEDICMGNEYPVLTVNGTGGACVSNGEEPPAGFARYPEGKVPQEVDDKWDVYWNTHTLDKDGKIIDAPDAG